MPGDIETAGGGDLLSDAGYSSGDFLPVISIGPVSKRNVSFTNTTYTNDLNLWSDAAIWNDLFQSGSTTAVQTQLGVNPGTDETVSVRIRNTTDGETVHELTGISGGKQAVTIGPTNYTPTTSSGRIIYRISFKTDTGSNSCVLENPKVAYGVRL